MATRLAIPPRPKRGILHFGRRAFRLRAPWPQPPLFWRKLTGAPTKDLPLRDCLLVLSARQIPYRIARIHGREQIYVPPIFENLALAELGSFAWENRPKAAFTPWELYGSWGWAPLYLLPLLGFYWLQSGAWPDLNPEPHHWQEIGSLDAIRIRLHGEWLRALTALWLHSGIMHLVGNLFFGSIFLMLLARLCGVGHACLLTLAGGATGNVLSLLLHTRAYASIGFSTAIFASIGACAGLLLWRSSEKIFMPLAAAAGLLAMLGTSGSNTDYGAHICGLGAGFFFGFAEGLALRRGWRLLPQALAALLAVCVPCLAWLAAEAARH